MEAGGLGFSVNDTVTGPLTGLEKLLMRKTLRPAIG